MLAERETDGVTTIRNAQLPYRQPRATLGEKLSIACRALVTNVTRRRAENPHGILRPTDHHSRPFGSWMLR